MDLVQLQNWIHEIFVKPFSQESRIVSPDKFFVTLVIHHQCLINYRLQAQKMNAEAAYRGMGDVFWKTLQHEGVRGFYKGMFPNLLKVIPSASITYLVYESMKKTLSLD